MVSSVPSSDGAFFVQYYRDLPDNLAPPLSCASSLTFVDQAVGAGRHRSGRNPRVPSVCAALAEQPAQL